MASTPIHFAMLSHPGRVRKGNEDMCAAAPEYGVFLVCDGMGGAAAGEVASRISSDSFLEALDPSKQSANAVATAPMRLDTAIRAANDAVYRYSRNSPRLHGMGTTLVALLVEPAGADIPAHVTLAHVGDSRCYLFRDGMLKRLTNDHSLVEEQLRAGEITAFEALYHPMRNIITRAVGSQPTVAPEIQPVEAMPGDVFLLASDGLTRELGEVEIGQILSRTLASEHLREQGATPIFEELCQTLVDQANHAGGGDNITVLLLRVE
jgi:serine/threonine protein phosphatase PrpC